MPIGLKGNSDGSGAIQIGGSDAISITTGLNTTFAGTVTATGTVAGSTGTLYPLTSGTAVASTSGTALDFTGIPSWAKRITVMFNGVSTNGGSALLIQLGAGSVEITGYTSGTAAVGNTVVGSFVTSTAGILPVSGTAAANNLFGATVFSLVSGNIWVAQGNTYSTGGQIYSVAGGKTLSGVLDRVRITSVTPDTFDAGSINILWE